jgi:DNA-binding SARP family transcriptional activator
MTGEGTLEFRLLGPLEVRLENRPLALGGVRQRGLLALLLLNANMVVSRDKLINDLWQDRPPERATNALAALVSRLRRVLPADVLVTRSGGYEASVEPDAIDIVRFERLIMEGGRTLAASRGRRGSDRARTQSRSPRVSGFEIADRLGQSRHYGVVAQSSSAISFAARAAPSVSTGR